MDDQSGSFCTREVERTLHELLKVHTQFRHLIEDKVIRSTDIIQLLFGDLSAGLRQKCIRKLLYTRLFDSDKGISH